MPNRAALILDIQVDFTQVSGRMPADQAQVETMITTLNQLGQQAVEAVPLILVGNEFATLDPLNLFRKFAAIKNSSGTQLDPRLQIARSVYFSKRQPNALSNHSLVKYLLNNSTEELLVAGLFAEGCVRSTVKAALRKGFAVSIIPDCIASRNGPTKTKMLNYFRHLNVFVYPSPSSWLNQDN